MNDHPEKSRTIEMHCSNKIDIYELDLLSVQINEWLWCLKADIPKYINFSTKHTKAKPKLQCSGRRDSKQTITLADFCCSCACFILDDFIFHENAILAWKPKQQKMQSQNDKWKLHIFHSIHLWNALFHIACTAAYCNCRKLH